MKSLNLTKFIILISIFHCSLALPKFLGNNTAQCAAQYCASELGQCLIDSKCRQAALCNAGCLAQTDANVCNVVCIINYGYNNTMYYKLMGCLVKNQCLPVSPPDGACLAQDNQTVSTLTKMDQLAGKWWVLKGLNCGQNSLWPGGYDYFPCQNDVFEVQKDGTWVQAISYCAGKNNTCKSNYHTSRASANITSPGVMTHYFLDEPIMPQVEYWRVISFYQDWMLYVTCGSTPAGIYGGASVATRTAKSITDIPKDIEKEFASTASKFGFDYYSMCISDVTQCPN